ncbi:MAG: tetratricopeptide repeat protein [Candidatus Gastranaerophilales bacterium]|nr:tetratricopeptide repeat protein [Candidatus Gastranaerophilales bacterium]
MKKKIIVIFAIFLFFASVAKEYTQQDAQRYSAYYSNGMQYLQNQQFNSAINEFRKVLRFSPYDATVQDALINSYYARAQYYKNTTKEWKKALYDYKSAYFYAKYWKKNPQGNILSLANSSLNEIKEIEKRLNIAQTPQARLQNAKSSKAQGELASAGYDFEQLKNGQYSEIALENLGNIYKNLNNLAIAMEYFRLAIEKNPTNPKLHFLYGVMLDEAQNYEASMEEYNLALKYGDKSHELLEILENKWTQNLANNPSDAQSYNNLGAIYQKQGDFEAARAQYQKAYALDNKDEVSLYNLASLYVQQKNFQNAIAIYDKLLINNPQNIEVMNYRANALLELMRYDEAISQYEKMLALNPNNQEIKTKIDNIIFNNFKGEKLNSYLLKKANANQNSYEAQFNYAFEMHKNKNYLQAVEYYNRALNINPSKEETYLNLAQIYLEQKKYDELNKIVQKALLVMPNNSQILQYQKDLSNIQLAQKYEIANKYFNAKDYQKALENYLKINDKTPELYSAIASCYWEMNDFSNADKYYSMILALEPNNSDALLNRAYANYKIQNYDLAQKFANQMLALQPQNQTALGIINDINQMNYQKELNSAIEKYENNDFSNALVVLNKILSKNSNDPYALYYKALILDNQEKYKEAVNLYEKYLQNVSQNDETTAFATSRVKELKDYLAKVGK